MALTRPPARDLLTLLLVLSTITISVYAAAGTVNYFRFYPALTSLQLELTTLTWTSTPEALSATVEFKILNPTDYQGIRLKVFQSFLEITLNLTEAIPQGSLPPLSTTGPLDPHGPMMVRLDFNGNREAPQRVYQLQNMGAEVRFAFDVNLTLQTFLDKTAILVVSYRCESTGQAGPCEQTAITPHPNREEGALPGRSGGGGI